MPDIVELLPRGDDLDVALVVAVPDGRDVGPVLVAGRQVRDVDAAGTTGGCPKLTYFATPLWRLLVRTYSHQYKQLHGLVGDRIGHTATRFGLHKKLPL